MFIIMEDDYLRNKYKRREDALERLVELAKRYREEIELEDRIEMPKLEMYELCGVAI